MNKIITSGALLVISDYNWLPSNLEDSWIKKYTDNYLIYDRAHRFEENSKIKHQKNVGQNVYDIFDFIYENYDNLPEIMIFCRAAFLNPKDNGTPRFNEKGEKLSNGNCSEEKFKEIANNKTFTEIHDFGYEAHLRYKNQPQPASKLDEDGFGFLEINNSWWFNSHSGKYFNNYNVFLNEIYDNPEYPEYVRFSPGANYIIPKTNIIRYSRKFYEKMREFIGWDIITGEAHLFERALYTIFTCDYKIKDKYK